MRRLNSAIEWNFFEEQKIVRLLMAVTPISIQERDNDDKMCAKTFDFSAEVRINIVHEIFCIFGEYVQNLELCQISDICSFNNRILNQLRLPHVVCSTHMLKLDVSRTISDDQCLPSLVNSTQDTMRNCKLKLIIKLRYATFLISTLYFIELLVNKVYTIK